MAKMMRTVLKMMMLIRMAMKMRTVISNLMMRGAGLSNDDKARTSDSLRSFEAHSLEWVDSCHQNITNSLSLHSSETQTHR